MFIWIIITSITHHSSALLCQANGSRKKKKELLSCGWSLDVPNTAFLTYTASRRLVWSLWTVQCRGHNFSAIEILRCAFNLISSRVFVFSQFYQSVNLEVSGILFRWFLPSSWTGESPSFLLLQSAFFLTSQTFMKKKTKKIISSTVPLTAQFAPYQYASLSSFSVSISCLFVGYS